MVRASVPLFLAIPVVLLAGIGAGAVNGYIVCRLGLPSLIVTLGTMALFRGLGYILLGTGAINELPDSLTNFGLNNIGSTAIPGSRSLSSSPRSYLPLCSSARPWAERSMQRAEALPSRYTPASTSTVYASGCSWFRG